MGISPSWGWKSTTGRFVIGRFRPFAWKTSAVGKDKVNKWEVCKLKITTIGFFCNHDSTHFSILRVSTNALYDCRFIYFHLLMKSAFLLIKGLLSLYDKKKIIHGCLWIWNFSFCVKLDIWLLRCAHSWAIELNTRREIPYLRAPMYCSLFISSFKNFKTWRAHSHLYVSQFPHFCLHLHTSPLHICTTLLKFLSFIIPRVHSIYTSRYYFGPTFFPFHSDKLLR